MSEVADAFTEQLKNLVVRVERLTKESFTDSFLATHNVSASCAARLCRHLKVLQGAGKNPAGFPRKSPRHPLILHHANDNLQTFHHMVFQS